MFNETYHEVHKKCDTLMNWLYRLKKISHLNFIIKIEVLVTPPAWVQHPKSNSSLFCLSNASIRIKIGAHSLCGPSFGCFGRLCLMKNRFFSNFYMSLLRICKLFLISRLQLAAISKRFKVEGWTWFHFLCIFKLILNLIIYKKIWFSGNYTSFSC